MSEKKIKPRVDTTYMLDDGNAVIVSGCPVCGKEATVDYDEIFGYTCACNTVGCCMWGNRASYFPTAFGAIHNWNGLTLAIDISRSKGGVDKSVLSRIFGPIPGDSVLRDESGSESE